MVKNCLNGNEGREIEAVDTSVCIHVLPLLNEQKRRRTANTRGV